MWLGKVKENSAAGENKVSAREEISAVKTPKEEAEGSSTLSTDESLQDEADPEEEWKDSNEAN